AVHHATRRDRRRWSWRRSPRSNARARWEALRAKPGCGACGVEDRSCGGYFIGVDPTRAVRRTKQWRIATLASVVEERVMLGRMGFRAAVLAGATALVALAGCLHDKSGVPCASGNAAPG